MNAAIAAKYSLSYAKARAYKIEQSVNVGMADAFERAGLTDKAIVEHGIRGLAANKVISANIIYGDADEKTNDFIDVPDWNARHKYYDTILRLTNRLKDSAGVNVEVKTIQTIVIGVPQERQPEYVNRLASVV